MKRGLLIVEIERSHKNTFSFYSHAFSFSSDWHCTLNLLLKLELFTIYKSFLLHFDRSRAVLSTEETKGCKLAKKVYFYGKLMEFSYCHPPSSTEGRAILSVSIAICFTQKKCHPCLLRLLQALARRWVYYSTDNRVSD